MSELFHGTVWSNTDEDGTLELKVEHSQYFLVWSWTDEEGVTRKVRMFPSYESLIGLAHHMRDWVW